MSNFKDFIGGGGGSASFPTIFLSKSQTWVPFQDGNICIHVIGAGGGGGVTVGNNNFSGGGAGGYTKKNSLAVTTSGSFTVVIGAAGQGGYAATHGTAGGETSVSGTGLSAQLRSVGGDAGLSNNTAASRSGGSGNGGDVTNDGGNGNMFGGGAVGLLGQGQTAFNLSNVPMSGQVDVLGDFWSSSMGQLAGGPRSYGTWGNPIALRSPEIAGPLSGGAAVRQITYSGSVDTRGGAASIGGGGGGSRSTSNAWVRGGDGGEGIVVIQYIP